MRSSVLIALLFILTLSNSSAESRTIRVKLFSEMRENQFILSVETGRYEARINNSHYSYLERGDHLIAIVDKGRVVVKMTGIDGFSADSAEIIPLSDNSVFRLQPGGKSHLRRSYKGGLTVFPDLQVLVPLNIVKVEDYLPAVVRAEAGPGGKPEFYKAQAIIARTYTYNNIHKHSSDNFNLCDGVHCQAYHGITTDQIINEAVSSTEGIVIIDNRGNLIISAFHSNCGGETIRSEWVWVRGESYLLPVIDPWCTSSRNAIWTKTIPKEEWKEYLYSKGLRTDLLADHDFIFRQTRRRENYTFEEFSLPLKQIRTDLDLRSTFFSVEVSGDNVTLSGKGYGHGVGLCQEGALEMAKKGYQYDQILSFYYANVLLSPVENTNLPVPTESQRQLK